MASNRTYTLEVSNEYSITAKQWGDFDGFELPSQSKLSELAQGTRAKLPVFFAPDNCS